MHKPHRPSRDTMRTRSPEHGHVSAALARLTRRLKGHPDRTVTVNRGGNATACVPGLPDLRQAAGGTVTP
jgi:hypothetical protein